MSVRMFLVIACAGLALTACGRKGGAPTPGAGAPAGSAAGAFAKLPRKDFNRRAAELDLPLFWRSDADGDGAIDPAELAVLWGVAGGGQRADFIDESQPEAAFTPAFAAAYERMATPTDLGGLPPAERKRRKAVLEELAQGRPTLVETDFRGASAEDKAVVDNILAAAAIVETIYARQRGVAGFAAQIPADDPASRMLMYRNQSPFCLAPKTEANPDCHALVERPKKVSGLYPAEIQSGIDTHFCNALEKRPDAAELLGPFTVVVAKAGGKAIGDAALDELEDVPYNVVYKNEMEQVSTLLMKAAAAIADPKEAPLQLYLAAAAESFLSNDWQPADEAWARMNATNSKWYLRIGPDEVYEDPCSRKAMFHATFARINPEGLEWQKKLEPRKNDMEAALAKLAGPPYAARQVSFQLPDFIDIVLNAGDARHELGATTGQSLPNWGAVASEGRGRTVAMVDLFSDADSEAAWRDSFSSLLCQRTMEKAAFEPKLGVMSAVLHEAAHNLGPSHDYQVGGRTAAQVFGGPLASMLEELKAQTSALYFTDWLVAQGLLGQAEAERTHLSDLAWSFGHIAEGMYDAEGKGKPYSQLSAIEVGFLAREGVLEWRESLPAANRKDKGCFEVDLAGWKAATERLEAQVLQIKGSGDRAGAEALKAEFVDARDDWAKLRDVIRERYLRAPKATLVYAVER